MHQKAGSINVIEVHGSWKTLRCRTCRTVVDSRPFILASMIKFTVPRCPECNAILKPDLVMMGEYLPITAWQSAENASRQCELMLVAGSSLEVVPVSYLPQRVLDRGAKLIIVNREKTPFNPGADVVLQGDVAVILPEIIKKLFE